jgi:Protein of unknown function (DUF3617)
MRLALLAPVLLGLSLTACGKSDTAASAKKGEVVKRDAGSWKSDITIGKFEVPGAPPEMKKMMEGMMKQASAIELCLTPDQAAKEDMAGAMAKNNGAKDCTFAKKEITGGTIAIDAVCKDPQGQSVNLKMAGTNEAKKTQALVTVGGKTPTGANMTMEMNMSSVWTGACKAGQTTIDGTKFAG